MDWCSSIVTVTCRYRHARASRFSSEFGNYLPGDESEFIYDPASLTVDGLKATAEQIKEIENDHDLMLKFEAEARKI